MTSNDQAFIIISKELIRRQNDLESLDRLAIISSCINQYARDRIVGVCSTREHTETYAGLSKIIDLLSDSRKLAIERNTIQERIEVLKNLSDTYLRGGNIVIEKLSKE